MLWKHKKCVLLLFDLHLARNPQIVSNLFLPDTNCSLKLIFFLPKHWNERINGLKWLVLPHTFSMKTHDFSLLCSCILLSSSLFLTFKMDCLSPSTFSCCFSTATSVASESMERFSDIIFSASALEPTSICLIEYIFFISVFRSSNSPCIFFMPDSSALRRFICELSKHHCSDEFHFIFLYFIFFKWKS